MVQSASPLTVKVSHDLKKLLASPASPARLNLALRLLSKWRASLVYNTALIKQGDVVASGPFAGMVYAGAATEGAVLPRLLGCYEASLQPVIETIIARAYPQVVDVGCAEGYYAVGLARRMPNSTVFAFDIDENAQSSTRALAQANDVAARVQVGGLLDHAGLALCAQQKTVLIVDIEGAEDGLLAPDLAPALRHTDILVETHDGLHPGVSNSLLQRFASTHKITKIHRDLQPEALPQWMDKLSDLDRLLALWEWRSSPTPWLWMQAHANN
ncbi:MAG: hypothetical protein EBR73_12140 [Rhodobacteraceae bacterium]|nr:hypothetical protein [Paracoccaceae bacterium]